MKINKEIYRIALPAIISNITVPLLGIADTTISGHLGSEKYIAAIAVGTMMMNVVTWCMGFLRSGTTGMTAQAYGSNDSRKTTELFTRSVSFGAIAGILILIVQAPLMWLLLKVISVESSVALYVTQYFRIVVWGAPAMLATMAISGWFLGMQSSFYPMIIAIVTNIVNILASLVSVYVLKYGFAGTAIGTCIANWSGFVLALFLVKHFNAGKFPVGSFRECLRFKGSGKFFKVNSDIFFRSFCIMAVTLGMTSFGARIGSLTLAVNAVMMQFFIFFSHFMDGFAFAAEALTGKGVGERNREMLRRTNRSLFSWSVGMAVFFTLTYVIFWPHIGMFITSEPEVLAALEQFHIWLILLPAVSVAAFIYDGIYIGLTATRQMLIATASGGVIFFLFNIAVNTDSSSADSNTYLWASFLLYLLVRGVALAALCPYATRKALNVS